MTTDQNPIKKPDALRLADELDRGGLPLHQAAATLRTQHALLERAREAIAADLDEGWDCNSRHPKLSAALADLTAHLEPK